MIEVREAPIHDVPRRGDAAVEVRELRKEFSRRGKKRGERRTRIALDGVTFAMERGETVAILGQNGSGKSTLVRVLSTLLLPDGGQALILGHDVVAEPRPVRRLVNRVSVEASFFKKMSAAENLGYAARYYGMTSGETRDLIPMILERVGFPAERRDEPMEALSRGMQQKVALARALLTSPVLLLLDEPTTGLDPQSRTALWEEVSLLRREDGVTVFLTTQYLEEADVLADRVGIIDRGKIVAEGTPADLKEEIGRPSLHAIPRNDGDRPGIAAFLARFGEPLDTTRDVAVRLREGLGLTDIVRAVDAEGIDVVDLELRAPTLDDVFLAKTGRTLEGAAEEAEGTQEAGRA